MSSSDVDTGARVHPSRRVLRWNAVLTVFLLGLIAVLGNALASRHFDVRRDLSADGLNVVSPETRRVVGRIEERMSVRVYATQEIRDGQLALRTARIGAQLEEILGLRPEAFDLQVFDPTRSSEARRQATEAGLRPRRAGRTGLGRTGEEEVWLGIVLGYRGRTEVVTSPEPWRFEVQIASAMHALLSDRKIGVGWIGAPFELPPSAPNYDTDQFLSTFTGIRGALSRRARLVPMLGLSTGSRIPDGVDVVFVVRPGAMHDREVYAIDQFVQRGGRLVVCIDDPDYNLFNGQGRIAQEDFAVSRFAQMLRSWGIRVAEQHVWDDEWLTDRIAVKYIAGEPRPARLRDPLVITLRPEGLAESLPPTRGLNRVEFSWAHPLFPPERVPLPAGVARTDLAWSSEDARVTDASPRSMTDPSEVRSLREVLRTQRGGRHVLAAVFSGRFPSPWDGMEPPRPDDPLGLAPSASEEPAPLSAVASSQIVVFGDADWLRDDTTGRGHFVQAGGGTLAMNLLDWLTLDEDLIGLRSRAPSLRPLRDFVAEEERALGLFEADLYPTEAERIEAGQKADLARRRAQRKQWMTMLVPAIAALAIVALFGVVWNLLGRRPTEGHEVTR